MHMYMYHHFADDIVILNYMVVWWYNFIQIRDMLSAILNNFVGLTLT